ncbi:histidinol dehydrogenase [Methanopyrus sp. SNP6]|uniref:histidinol dehydrogenase n=1 Tax=Methanopyrus sp. SNP6 TaxID=1937005 RepID=UPI001439EAA5|nr:histidinol dehydrogenase [Methanopyrus sp. SNP6]
MRLLVRPEEEELERVLRRSEMDVTGVLSDVERIFENVVERGDEALLEYTERFDGIELEAEDLRVSEDDFEVARELVDERTVEALEEAAHRIEEFHRKSLPRVDRITFDVEGTECGLTFRPVPRVGCYVPGGRASYPSTALMTVIPARVAGCREVIVCTPPVDNDIRASPEVLVAAEIAGADAVYRVGGAQAIAAMATGTEAVPRVDKIVGPGNVYVTAAKLLAYSRGLTDVDMPAGPSEVFVIADDSADPDWLARDLIAQAEHDPNAAAVLATDSEEIARAVKERIEELLDAGIEREEVVLKALDRNGWIVVLDSLEECVRLANRYAPEHLQLCVENPEELLQGVENAGTVFLGHLTAVPFGDYATGPNHVLPTGGFARARGALGTWDFVKIIPIQQLREGDVEYLAPIVEELAECEGLPNHAEAVKVRRS